MTGTSAVIPAAGRGKRFGKDFNKVLAEVAGKPLIAHTLSVFQVSPTIDEVTLVCGRADIDACREIVRRFSLDKVTAVVEGGEHRQESVWTGLLRIRPETKIVVIHDGARPLVTEQIIAESVSAAATYGAAIAAVPVTDTVKAAGADAFVAATLPREQLYAVQTPQSFQRDLIMEAHEKARAAGVRATDDAALVELIGGKVKITSGSPENIKVTQPRDLDFVRSRLAGGEAAAVRCGFGYDVHRFAPDRKLYLGGVEFPGEEGLEGHSDADVLLHAVCDALLGAAAAGDIGRLFPDTDSRYKGISSMKLLSQVSELLGEAGWRTINVDVTLAAQRPRIAAFVDEMKANIASALGVSVEAVSIKATTTEGLGSIGRAEGIACYAVGAVGR
ncbi:MAG: 2-C-methyl-D-erythritol 4-phosphate cytidylyltransferase [Armatimonadota bacterium]|nr:2-C-methyl-D-erythritol 4-phosphate cytidylyltransferase [Armatimonadota bacterium]